MKARDIALLNYTMFIFIAVVGWHLLLNYEKDFPIDERSLEEMRAKIDERLNYTLHFDVSGVKSKEKRESLEKKVTNLF